MSECIHCSDRRMHVIEQMLHNGRNKQNNNNKTAGWEKGPIIVDTPFKSTACKTQEHSSTLKYCTNPGAPSKPTHMTVFVNEKDILDNSQSCNIFVGQPPTLPQTVHSEYLLRKLCS